MKHLAILLLALLNIVGAENGYTEEHNQPAAGPSEPVGQPSKTIQARLEALDVLMKRRQYPQAYDLAERLVETFEGEPKFDFNYGLAAVETAHFDQALFAFERLVIGFPTQSRYRLELARTHFYLQNLIRAEIEFNKVLAQNPPKAVQSNVHKFLDRIIEIQRSVKPKFMFALDMAAGFDSNINSATDEKSLPLILDGIEFTVPLDNAARETGSSYWSTLLNFAYLSPLTKTSAYDLRVIASKRENSEIDSYNLDTAMAEAGYSFYTGSIRWRGAGRYQFIQLNGEAFLDTSSLIGQGNWVLKSGFSYGLAFNYGLSAYADNPNADLTQQHFNLSFASAPKKRSWAFAFVFGSDEAAEASNDASAKSYQGLNYQSTTLWGQRGSRYWLLSIMSSKYNAINPIYGKLRKDTALNYGIGWRYYIFINCLG